MKVFIALACLAVASADPLSYLGANPYLVNPLVNPYGIHPYAVNPLFHKSAKDAVQQALMKKQLVQQSAQLAAQNAGDKVAEAAAYASQQITQNIEKQAVEGKLIPAVHLVKREAEPYTIAQANALFGLNPYVYGGYLRTPLVSSLYNRVLYKREAESDPSLLVHPYASTLLGARSLVHPYAATLNPYLVNPYNVQVPQRALINSENAQVYKADLINPFTLQQTNYVNDRAIDAPEYAGRGKTVHANPGAVHISKREADPAVLLRTPYATTLGYPYGLRSSVLGYPYGLRYSSLGYF